MFILHGETPTVNGKRAHSTEYVIWYAMLTRCYKPYCKAYENYGGRGITVCDRWRFGTKTKHPVVCFIEDMGRRPSSEHCIERRNNDGNYTPRNCVWATRAEQNNNKRFTRNTVGLPGAQPCGNKFRAQIRLNGRLIHLGVFDTAEEASAAYLRARTR